MPLLLLLGHSVTFRIYFPSCQKIGGNRFSVFCFRYLEIFHISYIL